MEMEYRGREVLDVVPFGNAMTNVRERWIEMASEPSLDCHAGDDVASRAVACRVQSSISQI